MKVRSRKSTAEGEMPGGSGGGALEEAMWKRAEICEVKCDHGGLPVSISTSTQPTDQTSAGKEWPVCLITSGAIQ